TCRSSGRTCRRSCRSASIPTAARVGCSSLTPGRGSRPFDLVKEWLPPQGLLLCCSDAADAHLVARLTPRPRRPGGGGRVAADRSAAARPRAKEEACAAVRAAASHRLSGARPPRPRAEIGLR